jgi:heme oxygenase (biliverdin-IX-beta and delta-forming)
MEKSPLPSSPTALSVMDQLKLATQPHHTQTEKVANMKRLFASDYSLQEYRQHLEKVYGYLSIIEPVLLRTLPDESWRSFFAARSKQAWLKQDLAHFGLSPEQILALPSPPAPNYLHNLAQCLGAYYVLEGSSLGGQVISKHLSQHFGDAVIDKLRFYQGYGEQTRANWLEFGERMKIHFPDEKQPEVAQMLVAAQLTFDWLAEWLQSRLV